MLENVSTNEYYFIFRFREPKLEWRGGEVLGKLLPSMISRASATFAFLIKDKYPNYIIDQYRSWYYQTALEANPYGNNCAVAAQWFLNKFADIPEPGLSNISVNRLALGVM